MIINKSCAFQLPFTRQKQKNPYSAKKSAHSGASNLKKFYRECNAQFSPIGEPESLSMIILSNTQVSCWSVLLTLS
jgi:hypothetical protein